MADHNTTALDELAETDNVTTLTTPSGCIAYVAPEATTAGPALDPVEAWAAHTNQYRPAYKGVSEDGTACYKIEEVED